MSKYIVGIDLGTTTSLVAVMMDGKPTLIPNERGSYITPSVVGISETGEVLVGEPAKNQAVSHPERTIYSVKRIMGSEQLVTLGDKEFTPQEISALILKKLKLDAEAFLGEVVSEAVITVPAYFTDAQRQATKDAGEIAGFKVERIINEPTAAALAYGFEKQGDKTIMVYDLGGGTFDVSIIRSTGGTFKVLASAGNNHLGGDDFDWKLVDYLVEEFQKREGINLKAVPNEAERRVILQRLKDAAEKAKIDLSTLLETTVNLPFIYTGGTEPKHLNITISRATFEKLTSSLVENTIEPMERALADAKLSKDEIDAVVLVGGSTRMPQVQRLVTEFMGREPKRDINPEYVVAMGAAIQAGIKSGELDEVVVIDVAPYTLGIEVVGDKFSPIIPRNSPIPISRKRPYVTTEDYQTEATIIVRQGESPIASENELLGEFKLSGIEPRPKGEAVIEVQFDYDVNGIVKVTARDRTSGAQKSLVIKTSQKKLGEEEIRKAQLEIGKLSGTMLTARARSEDQYKAESAIFEAEGLLRENEELIKPEDKEKIEFLIAQLKKALDDEDYDAMDELRQKLEDAINEVKLYLK